MFPVAAQNREAAPARIPGITLPSIKMGLWEETTSVPNSSTVKTRSCITQQTYQAVFGRMLPGCTISNPKQTSSSIDADLSCSMSGVNSTGHLSVQIADPGTVHTAITYTTQVQGQTMQGTITADSHWISAGCGKIPPGETRDVE